MLVPIWLDSNHALLFGAQRATLARPLGQLTGADILPLFSRLLGGELRILQRRFVRPAHFQFSYVHALLAVPPPSRCALSRMHHLGTLCASCPGGANDGCITIICYRLSLPPLELPLSRCMIPSNQPKEAMLPAQDKRTSIANVDQGHHHDSMRVHATSL